MSVNRVVLNFDRVNRVVLNFDRPTFGEQSGHLVGGMGKVGSRNGKAAVIHLNDCKLMFVSYFL